MYRNKKVVVIGAGESGLSAAKLLRRSGAEVSCSAEKVSVAAQRELESLGIPFESGGHTTAFFKHTSTAVLSPGVRPDAAILRQCRRRKIRIVSELELASHCLNAPWAAVTGTNGKTTTTSLVAEMLGKKRNCVSCGNIGRSLSRSVLEDGERIARVVECSSFQLCFSPKFSPQVAVILNLNPNHLDWHPNLRHYYASKCSFAARMRKTGTLVLNADDPALRRRMVSTRARRWWFSLNPLAEGAFTDGDNIVFRSGKREKAVASLKNCRMRYPHQRQNVLAAVSAAHFLGARPRHIQAALDEVRPLRHRMEELGAVRGIRFVNDSKSTTLASTRAAVLSCEGGLVLIAGGRLKEKSYAGLAGALKGRVRHLVLYGEGAPFLWKEFRDFKSKTRSVLLDDAVRCAFKTAQRGQTLLLSPMGSSFDQFRSYGERGDAFRRLYRELKVQEKGGRKEIRA